MDAKPNLKADVDPPAPDATIQKDPPAESMKESPVLASEDPPASLGDDAAVIQTRDGSGTFSGGLLENVGDEMLRGINIEEKGDENSISHERSFEATAESEADGTVRLLPPEACRRCKGFKVRCTFPPNKTICIRCEHGGHLCTVEGWVLPPGTSSLSSMFSRRTIQRLPGACISCIKLKVRCDFPENESVCSHCKATDHVCIEARGVRSSNRKRLRLHSGPSVADCEITDFHEDEQRSSHLYDFPSKPVSQGRHVYQVKGNERPRPKPY